ncbi:PTS sugar transporter subunit IIA [Atopobacter phocae]|uniref:PTS sugar transporter subunit IIA n=1 Tax=Atopobacter phocae TaxID=136492 RepID=UPI00046EE5F0|nr:PTS sugar transporter subunit IIA [Atopobacter phocae]
MTVIFEDTTYVLNVSTKEEIFEKISSDLLKKDLITESFLEKIIERERSYPTGLNMRPVNPEYPNIAIPHTESEYVKTTRIVPIKLMKPVLFNNMIDPSETLEVSFLFMILNGKGETQAGLLAQIMDFINSSNKNELLSCLNSDDPKRIYEFISNNF